MSDFLNKAASELGGKIAANGFDGTAKIAVADVGSIMLDSDGATVGDGDADVTLNADEETFQSIFDGDLNATSAFMTGKLTVDGDMGMAMKLASVLA
ncbi:MAG: SCP2 sterol-binding domain-containing protein [Sedimentitalea sp.]